MVSEIGAERRVNVVLTNPPFGGEEEELRAAHFPTGYQVRETSILFLRR